MLYFDDFVDDCDIAASVGDVLDAPEGRNDDAD